MKTSITDFKFKFAGYGHYSVTYTSPRTGKQYHRTINDMTLIDCTKNADQPKKKNLELLKWMCKNYQL